MLASDGRYDEAESQLAAVPPKAKERPLATRARVYVALRTHQSAKAEALASDGLAAEPDAADLRTDRARARLASGRLDESLEDVDRVLSKDPRDPTARDLRARVVRAREARRRVDLARESAEKATGLGVAAAFTAGLAALVELAFLQAVEAPEAPRPARAAEFLAEVRALGQRGDRAGALDLLRDHLAAHPNDTDARTLFGTILSWEGRYPEARAELARVEAAVPGHGDAARAAIRVELWSDNPSRAEEIATKAISLQGEQGDLLLLRARARLAQRNFASAKEDVDRVLAMDPSNIEARRLAARVKAESIVWAVSLSYALDGFSDGRTPWHEVGIVGRRQFKWGSAIARVFNAWRFDSNDQQFELEAFPSLRPGTYADVGVAIAPRAELYPGYRLQLDLYQTFRPGFEVSAGFRHMKFDNAVNVVVLTINKYYSDWLFSVRSFITPGVAGTSVSVSGALRRYFMDGAFYAGLRYGYGLSKEELRSVNDVALLGSNTVGAEASFVISDRVELGLRGAISQEAKADRPDLWQYGFVLGVGYRF